MDNKIEIDNDDVRVDAVTHQTCDVEESHLLTEVIQVSTPGYRYTHTCRHPHT